MAENNIKPPKQFIINSNEDVAKAWRLWLQQFEWYAIATNLEEKKPAVQVAVFMACIGPDAVVIYNTFNLSSDEKLQLQTIKDKFTNHFTPKINESYERYIFNTIIQKEGQPFDEFLTELKSKVKNCEYGTLEDSLIRDRIVIGVRSDSLREKLLAEHDLTLQKTIDLSRSAEQVKMQVKTMKQAPTVDAVTWNSQNTNIKKKEDNIKMNNKKREDKSEETFHCGRCDTIHGRRNCPAFKKICLRCNRRNHLTKCCKIKTVDSLLQNEEYDSEDGFMVSSIDTDDDVGTEDWYEPLTLPNGVTVMFKLDSGSRCNVINREIMDRTKSHLSPSTTRYLTSYSKHKMQVLGEAKLVTIIKGRQNLIKYYVVDEKVSPILGRKTCEKLNLVKRIDAITINDDLFEGIGCLKQYKYDIDLVDNPKLPICPARKIPHTIRQKVKDELDSMVEQKIIKPVTKPTPAVSPMVVVKKNDKIRLCLDPSEINKNLKRRHYPLNTLEEIAARIHGSKWFTLLDCRKGFWQLQVTPRTSDYLTFSTPFGRYSCLRMPFGLASAPEVFQQVMSSLLADLENTEVSMDDVLLHASSKDELEKTTQKVLEKLRNAGLKLNKEKCVFSTQEVKFLGHIVTSKGLKPDPEKIETITKIKRPENIKELQRFLGLITYLSKFIKNMADITSPLRQLLHKDVEWIWDQPQEEAFLKLKELLKNPPVLGFYDPQAPILLSVDASSYACGGVMIQKEKPIAYCAKSFTKTEQGYSQLEKEANAILVACKKFHNYIWGCKDLTIESDHKPLETIFRKPLTSAPPRLQRMLYQILPYNPKVTYKKGSEMYVADTLSRDCEKLNCEDVNSENLQVCAIVPFSKNRRQEIKQEIENSSELKTLKQIIQDGWPEKMEQLPDNLKKYWHYRETLSVYNNLIFKNDRVLVPISMVPLVMKQCHLGHKGIQGTIRLARDNVFWPGMTTDLVNYTKSCTACAKVQKDNPMEPIVVQTAPERPWSLVATDLFHLKGKDYILIADGYSGFFDLKELKGVTSFDIIDNLKSWFATFGIPDILLTDGEDEKKYADRGKKENKEFVTNENVMLRKGHRNWVPAKIVTEEGHRAYKVETDDGAIYKRNSWHLKPTENSIELATKDPVPGTEDPDPVGQPSPIDQSPVSVGQPSPISPAKPTLPVAGPEPQPLLTAPQPRSTRSGRLVVTPARYR
ncbi:uncharacterized protein K02A2.6-like [Cydia pomonella]|uniref:uncharacterized protein K02A2.6-like n=1 Tax=Cydia pomonella TaxID=82600 RepID=UPI002ADDA06A|nr:uncharacterized protein K02A2.6-like [Cydia pomonella]